MNPASAFLDMLVAAMQDAATQGKITQLKTTISPDGKGPSKFIRIIVLPEEMEFTWPTDQPFGTDPKKN